MIAVIALLIGILLPALGKAREEARAVVCATNARSAALGVAIYVSGDRAGYFPPSYVYGNDRLGFGWDVPKKRCSIVS